MAKEWDGPAAMGAALTGAAAGAAKPDEWAAAVSVSAKLAAERTPIAKNAAPA
jgi:hypothetical protein